MTEKRLDIALVDMGLSSSRERAKELIKSGQVMLNGCVCDKPSKKVSEYDKLEIIGETFKYVSRGGLKLEQALEMFELNISINLFDIGASTGGFTTVCCNMAQKGLCS